MIGSLRGQLVHKQPPLLVLDVDGVGYELEAPMTTFYELPATGAEVLLHTHLVVRDDAHLLYGFSERRQRDLFRDLLRVNGVGPRVGLAILSGMSADDFYLSVVHEDASQLTRVPGIGPKTAKRVLMEMKDRLGAQPLADAAAIPKGAAAQTAPSPVRDAVSALIALGYKPVEASKAVRSVESADRPSEEIIREALRAMTGGDA